MGTRIKNILIFNPGTEGGIQRYAYFQGKALRDLGCEVTVLCDRGHHIPEQQGIPVDHCLLLERPKRPEERRLSRVFQIAGRILRNEWRLASHVFRHRPDAVLLSSYSEYLSPLWVVLQVGCKHLLGVAYIANLHDPVRDFVVGPRWWHALSVRLAYLPLSVVHVHQKVTEKAHVPAGIRISEVPHGLFEPGLSGTDPVSIRRDKWDVPPDGIVFLAFGFIRDGKNLNLLVASLVKSPAAYLIIMGRVQSASNNRPGSYYRDLAEELGVASRVRIFDDFVPDEVLGGYLAAADVIAVTYSAAFHSQSGVLNTIAHVGKPILASSGESPLKDCVLRFDLGIFVPPDNQEVLDAGMVKLCAIIDADRHGAPPATDAPKLDWVGYRGFASWETNARIVLEGLGGCPRV